jgi:PAS domain S-box-containing protein
MVVQVKAASKQSEEQILAGKQLDLIYQRHSFAFWSTLLLSGALAIALWPMVNHTALLAWLLSLWLVMAVRDVYARRYLRLAREEAFDYKKWQFGLLLGAVITGLCWGFSVLSISSSPTEPATMMLLFVLAGVTAFAGISMAAVPQVAQVFLLPALLPVSFWLFSFGERLPFFMGAMTLGYLVLMLLFSRQTHRTIRSLLAVTEQNKVLAAALAQVKELERESALFRRIVDETRDPAIFVVNTKSTLSFDYINEAVCAHFGASREEIMSWDISDWDPHYDVAKVDELHTALKQAGSLQFESEHLNATGERFPVEVTLNLIEFEGESFVVGYFRSLTRYKAEQARIRELESAALRQESEQRMTEALIAREQEFRSLAESSPDKIVRYDLNGCHRYLNSALVKMLGLSCMEEALGKRPREMWTDGRYDKLEQVTMQVVESGVAVTFELREPDGAGGEYVHLVSVVPERDAAGQIIGTIIFGRDITERKRMEEALVAREQEFRSLAESSLDFIIRYDREGRTRYLNTVLLNMLGLSNAAEVVGKRPGETWPDGRFDAIEQAAARVVESGVVATIELCGPDGTGVHHLLIAPERDAAGLIVGTIVFGRDITEIKRGELELHNSFKRISDLNVHLEQNARDLEDLAVELEVSKEQLQQTEAWYRGIVHSAPDGMLVVDEQGRIIQVNAQLDAMFGYEGGALPGCHVEVLLPQAVIQHNLFDRHSGANKDLFGRRKDGSEFPVDVSLSRLPDLDGRTGAICAAVRDVTERQKMDVARESALFEALRLAQLRSTFMAQMSHELRTPLNGILGYAQNLLQGDALGEKQVAGLHIIRHSGEHLLSLINGILDHASIEAGKFELVPGDLELEPFLGTLIGIIRVRAEEKNIAFTCDAGHDLPAIVRGDAQRLRQVLLNLLSNAVKFTDSGYVNLRVNYVAPSRIRFVVQDSGIGIAADQLENIFLSFEQAGETHRRAGGTGLGLAISHKLVRLMGGDIKVESQLGKGSTFSFEIEMDAVLSDTAKVNVAVLAEQAATRVAQAMPMQAVPPKQELDILHGFALLGSMRKVMLHADQLADADGRYLPFADQLRQLAKSFQTKALLGLIEQYRNGKVE